MAKKILTIDDSRSIRVIVKKALKNHDVQIFEASDGIEGLKAAEEHLPDLILLDITMPNMNGIDMLKELKANHKLKKIPVIMLTAEGNKDVVMKIAKIGIRDYIVKPFNENTLIEKIHKVIQLTPKTQSLSKNTKSISDPLNIVIVENKPVIVEQFQTAFKNLPWTITPVEKTTKAIELFKSNPTPDLAIVSLSLPEDNPYSFASSIREIPYHSRTPIFGLVLKTDQESQTKAKQAGFTDFFTKPLNTDTLCDSIICSLKLDLSSAFFETKANHLIIKTPPCQSENKLIMIKDKLDQEIADAVDSGLTQVLFDIQTTQSISLETVKMLIHATKVCNELSINYLFKASKEASNELKNNFAETTSWEFLPNPETANKD